MKWHVLILVPLQLLLPAVGLAQVDREIQTGLSHMLTLGGVIKELELTDEQSYNVDDLWLEIREDLQKAFVNFAQNTRSTQSPEQRRELEFQLASAIQKIRDKELERLNDVLLPHQVKRLNQIRIQFLKRRVGTFAAIAEELQLTPDQKKSISRLSRRREEEFKQLNLEFRNGNVTQAELTKRIADMQKENETELLGLLTPEQRKILKDLEGKVFEFQMRESVKDKPDQRP